MQALAKILALTLVVSATTGCLSLRKKPAPTPEPEPTPSVTAAPTCDAEQETIEKLRAHNRSQAADLISERAEVEELRARLAGQQELLDEAIQEVVRARAKQRSVQSRAQAAAEIAEAEIALDRLSDADRESNEGEQAARMLARASEEFDNANFGGALYLATQSKNGIRLAGLHARNNGAMSVEGEQTFRAPVPLDVVQRSNFREGPGTEFEILQTIEAGTRVTGHASKGPWIRATSDDGTAGWIHNSLVDGS